MDRLVVECGRPCKPHFLDLDELYHDPSFLVEKVSIRSELSN